MQNLPNLILSHRANQIKPSATLAMAATAARLKAEGRAIISLATGEPDFDTPDFVKKAGIAAIESNFTKYTPTDGIVPLRQAVIDKMRRVNRLEYTLPQVMISAGGKDCLFNLTQALLNPGDEVIIPAPYWVSYTDIVLLAEGKPVIIPTTVENSYKITPEQLESAITPQTKLFIINSPSNPTGQIYTTTELKALADVLLKHPHVWVATDDIYESIGWEGIEPGWTVCQNILNVCPELYERTLVLNSVSKTYAMTGWRIGYITGDSRLIQAMSNIQSQSISNPTSIAQKAALEALNGSQDLVGTMVKAYKERHTYLYEALKKIPGVKVAPSHGTFYLFVDIREILTQRSIPSDTIFVEKLLMEQGLALVPGSAFGYEGAVRLSFAVSPATLEEAVTRFTNFLKG